MQFVEFGYLPPAFGVFAYFHLVPLVVASATAAAAAVGLAVVGCLAVSGKV